MGLGHRHSILPYIRNSQLVGESAEKVSSAQIDILTAKVEQFDKAPVAQSLHVAGVRNLPAAIGQEERMKKKAQRRHLGTSLRFSSSTS